MIRKIVCAIVLSVFVFCIDGVDAKVKNTAKAKSSQSVTAAKKSKGVAKPLFNGKLTYLTHTFRNKTYNKQVNAGVENMDNLVLIYLVGNDLHYYDGSLRNHYLVKGNGQMYMYNDLSTEGILTNVASQFGQPGKVKGEKKRSVRVLPEKLSYLGDACESVVQDIDIDGGKIHNEMWFSKDVNVGKHYGQLVYNGMPAKGLVRKALFTTEIELGSDAPAQLAIAMELVTVDDKFSDKSKMEPPSNVKFTKTNDKAKIATTVASWMNVLNKSKSRPKKAKEKTVKKEISREWAYAEAWFDKGKSKSKSDNFDKWMKIGGAVVSALSSLDANSGGVASGSETASGTVSDTWQNGGSTGGSNSRTKQDSGRCPQCQGSGKCSPKSYSGRNLACHGSGKCQYCNGDGYNYTGGNPHECGACHGSKKCKTCGGSGKCSRCHGTGK